MQNHPVLHQAGEHGIRLGTERLREFLGGLGSPQGCAPAVHVAGTNGKGSVTRMVSCMQQAHGLQVGEYTSPHLQHVNERVRVNGACIDDDALEELLLYLDRHRRAWAAADPDASPVLTYFELMTALGLVWFARSKVDILAVEVGLGGRLDATCVVDPVVCAITSIGLDHTDRLGDDLASIGAEKAGILRPGVPAVVGRLPPSAMRVVRSIAAQRGAPLWVQEEDFRMRVQADGGLCWTGPSGEIPGLVLGMQGEHQIDNAAVAVAAVQCLPPSLRPTEDAIRGGLAQAVLAGRLEWAAEDLLLDCAHNAPGAERLAAYLRGLPRTRPRTLLLGLSADKDARSLAVALAPLVDRVLTTHCAHPRAAKAGELAAQLVDLAVPVLPAGPIETALPLARAPDGLLVVAGSVFLAGAVRDLLGRA